MRTILLATAALLGWTSAAMAQEPATPPQPPAASAEADRLPVSLTRVRKQLMTPAPRKSGPGLRLEYHVDVYGRAPKLLLFEEVEPFGRGPVPFTAPTHRDLINHVTPQGFFRRPS